MIRLSLLLTLLKTKHGCATRLEKIRTAAPMYKAKSNTTQISGELKIGKRRMVTKQYLLRKRFSVSCAVSKSSAKDLMRSGNKMPEDDDTEKPLMFFLICRRWQSCLPFFSTESNSHLTQENMCSLFAFSKRMFLGVRWSWSSVPMRAAVVHCVSQPARQPGQPVIDQVIQPATQPIKPSVRNCECKAPSPFGPIFDQVFTKKVDPKKGPRNRPPFEHVGVQKCSRIYQCRIFKGLGRGPKKWNPVQSSKK